MTPVPEWRRVLRHAWSIRLMAIAAALSGLDAAQPLWSGFVPLPPIVLALIVCLVSAGAFIARLFAQKHLSGTHDDYPTEHGDGQ